MKARDIRSALAADPLAVFDTTYSYSVRGLSGGLRGSWRYGERCDRHGPQAGVWRRAGPSPSWHWAMIQSRELLGVL